MHFLIKHHSNDQHEQISPCLNNVIFASTLYQTLFSLKSFADLHFKLKGVRDGNSQQFAKMLWGDIWPVHVEGKTKFRRERPEG